MLWWFKKVHGILENHIYTLKLYKHANQYLVNICDTLAILLQTPPKPSISSITKCFIAIIPPNSHTVTQLRNMTCCVHVAIMKKMNSVEKSANNFLFLCDLSIYLLHRCTKWNFGLADFSLKEEVILLYLWLSVFCSKANESFPSTNVIYFPLLSLIRTRKSYHFTISATSLHIFPNSKVISLKEKLPLWFSGKL